MIRCLIAALAGALLALSPGPAALADTWRAVPVDPSSFPPAIVADTRDPASDGLPDGLVSRAEQPGDIAAAWYAAPTRRYGHGVLGDAIEAGALVVETPDGQTITLTLPGHLVFEDRYPRLADLDGDGRVEVVTIRAALSAGGSVAVYGLDDGRLVLRGATGFIGIPNRWLNIAGIADFEGIGDRQIAYVQTPHIGGTLRVVALRGGDLVEVASAYGFSNHAIGARELRLSAVADIDGDGRAELAVPSADRWSLRIVGVAAGGISDLASVPLPARIDKAIAVEGDGPSARFVVGLGDGSVLAVTR